MSLLPSATEILFAIGAGDEVVGVTHECDFPEAAKRLRVLTSSALPGSASSAQIDRHVRKALHQGSSLYNLDADLLAQLAPDLIVTQELCDVCAVSYSIVDRAVRRLPGDPRIVSLEPSSLQDVYATIEMLGELTSHAEGARTLLAAMRERESLLRARTRDAIGPRILVLEWTDPPMSGGHWTPGLLEAAGAIAVLGNPGANSRVLSWDEMAAADPDAVIVAPCGLDLPATQRAIEDLRHNDAWNALRAVREGRVHAVDGNAYVNRPGPRLIDTMEIFEKAASQVRHVVQAE